MFRQLSEITNHLLDGHFLISLGLYSKHTSRTQENQEIGQQHLTWRNTGNSSHGNSEQRIDCQLRALLELQIYSQIGVYAYQIKWKSSKQQPAKSNRQKILKYKINRWAVIYERIAHRKLYRLGQFKRLDTRNVHHYLIIITSPNCKLSACWAIIRSKMSITHLQITTNCLCESWIEGCIPKYAIIYWKSHNTGKKH